MVTWVILKKLECELGTKWVLRLSLDSLRKITENRKNGLVELTKCYQRQELLLLHWGSKRLLSTVFHQMEARGIKTKRLWHDIKLIIVKTVEHDFLINKKVHVNKTVQIINLFYFCLRSSLFSPQPVHLCFSLFLLSQLFVQFHLFRCSQCCRK